jgi:hypothetical protein
MMSVQKKNDYRQIDRPPPPRVFLSSVPFAGGVARAHRPRNFSTIRRPLKKVSFDLDARVPYQIKVIVSPSAAGEINKQTSLAWFSSHRRTLVHDATRLYTDIVVENFRAENEK